MSAPTTNQSDARLTMDAAAAQLADALDGAMAAVAFEGDPSYADENEATWWFCRKALWDYAEARPDNWEPYCMDDRRTARPTVAYESKLAAAGKAFGWITDAARASRPQDGGAA